MKIYMAIFVLILSISTKTFAADFSLKGRTNEQGNKVWVISLTGEISEGDFEEYLMFFEMIQNKGQIVTTVGLNSNGGSVEEALKIGHHIRKNKISTYVTDVCYSSCALIYYGGLQRYTFKGKVGVHRSYFKDAKGVTFDEMENALNKNHKMIEKYFRTMRVPDEIIQSFLSTSSQSIKIVEEKTKTRDRLFAEFLLSNCGAYPSYIPLKDDWLCSETDGRAWMVKKNGVLIPFEKAEYFLLDNYTRSLCEKTKNHYENSGVEKLRKEHGFCEREMTFISQKQAQIKN